MIFNMAEFSQFFSPYFSRKTPRDGGGSPFLKSDWLPFIHAAVLLKHWTHYVRNTDAPWGDNGEKMGSQPLV